MSERTVPSPGNLVIHRQRRRGRYWREPLGNGADLEMVLVPGGEFWMGSPEDELDRYDDEGPRHRVRVPTFLMGKYPVTQAQWRAVAALPQVEQALKPDPSRFKGANRPVEQVSWDDAVEFCRRLSQHSGRNYRLPSEAEWEYACRAGTSTPFHFGETITTDLANYRGTDNKERDWSGSYGPGPKGEYREQTTEVGSFLANGFGLYDMHGNVWEWCADDWHDNYEGAPNDASAWVNENRTETQKVLRGGSWYNNPRICRSAIRNSNSPDFADNSFGFRVACAASRTLP
ncbi:MAG: formylglycine-generating enzyme family protein [Phormidium sp. BM_Day4_Bin.17]|nr:formylglycine-generating enzyme family protein [Phormidium sp. BM_Day4_Bin.17]UCJ12789.1 MAG: formylglycine-generating enzyme family protein [Phormidium sp. PBR-2020]